jgi:staphylococcal nuclease domain-containing protein 1
MMPVDSHAFVTEWKGKSIDGKSTTLLLELLKLYLGFVAIVEQVREGTTLRVRLLMPDGEHQMVNIALAGVRSARASTKQGESSEPYGEEVKFTLPFNVILPISFPPLGKIFHRIPSTSTPCQSTNIIFTERRGNSVSKYCQCCSTSIC